MCFIKVLREYIHFEVRSKMPCVHVLPLKRYGNYVKDKVCCFFTTNLLFN